MNEILLFLTAVVSTSLVLIAWKFSKVRMYGVMTLFLILIATVGGKIALFFGHPTNTGNIFYGAVFLATYFILERYGPRYTLQATWLSVIGVLFYLFFVGLAVFIAGSQTTVAFNAALATIFSSVPRVGIASIISFILSQHLNIALYQELKARTGVRYLWLRANISNVLAQTLDSVVFFVVAFLGVIPPEGIGQVILTGFVIKVVYIAVASPLLYLNKFEERKDENGVTMVTWH